MPLYNVSVMERRAFRIEAGNDVAAHAAVQNMYPDSTQAITLKILRSDKDESQKCPICEAELEKHLNRFCQKKE